MFGGLVGVLSTSVALGAAACSLAMVAATIVSTSAIAPIPGGHGIGGEREARRSKGEQRHQVAGAQVQLDGRPRRVRLAGSGLPVGLARLTWHSGVPLSPQASSLATGLTTDMYGRVWTTARCCAVNGCSHMNVFMAGHRTTGRPTSHARSTHVCGRTPHLHDGLSGCVGRGGTGQGKACG